MKKLSVSLLVVLYFVSVFISAGFYNADLRGEFAKLDQSSSNA